MTIILINIMEIIKIMNIKKIKLLISKNNIYVLFYILVLVSCTVSPGMQNPYKPSYS